MTYESWRLPAESLVFNTTIQPTNKNSPLLEKGVIVVTENEKYHPNPGKRLEPFY